MTKPFDPLVLRIGHFYRYGLAAHVEAGKLLAEKKAGLKHGEWLPWLRANADALGFASDRTAQRLIKLADANPALTTDLPDAKEITQKLWGNDNKSTREPASDDDKSDALDEYSIPPPQPSLVKVRLTHVPCELAEANAVVAAWHRHHKPLPGHRFSIKCIDENGVLRGVAIVGRPLARMTCQRTIVEVTLLCSDGTPNVCSYLYGVCARAAKVLGYRHIQTFTLVSEPGVSLKAAGWLFDGISKIASASKGWQSRSGRRDQPNEPKKRWVKVFRPDAKLSHGHVQRSRRS